jgi:hypothetical protein
MKIGIIGSGMIGGAIGVALAAAGYEVLFSSRHPEQLNDIVQAAGNNARSGEISEAAEFGAVLILAVPFWAIEELSEKLGQLDGKVLIDVSNPFPQRDGDIAKEVLESGQASSKYVANCFPHASLVKAFNTIYYKDIKEHAFRKKEKRALPYAGSEKSALQIVREMIEKIGFEPIHIGPISESHPMDANQALFNNDLTANEIRKILEEQ